MSKTTEFPDMLNCFIKKNVSKSGDMAFTVWPPGEVRAHIRTTCPEKPMHFRTSCQLF